MEGLLSSVQLGFGLILVKLGEVVVELLPDGLSPRLTFHSLQWEMVMCPHVVGSLVGLLLILRLVQSVRGQLYIQREKRLAEAVAAGIEEKCQLLDKLSTAQKEYLAMQSSIEIARLEKESLNIPSLTDTYRKVKRTNAVLMEEVTDLVEELKGERSQQSKDEEETAELLQVLECMEEVMRLATPRGALPKLPGGQEQSPDGPVPRSGPGS